MSVGPDDYDPAEAQEAVFAEMRDTAIKVDEENQRLRATVAELIQELKRAAATAEQGAAIVHANECSGPIEECEDDCGSALADVRDWRALIARVESK